MVPFGLREKMFSGKSWIEQGLPYCSGTLRYENEVWAPPSLVRKKAFLDCGEVRDHLKVLLDGERVALKLWRPCIVDVTSRLKEGKNDVRLRVTNTATNLITGTKKTSGLLSGIRLVGYGIR